MFLKKSKPTNNGCRHQVKLSSAILSNIKYRKLNIGFKKSSGRTKTGRISVRGRIGYKSNYIVVDFFRRYSTKLGVILNNTKNSNRSTLVSLVKYSCGSYSYILSALGFINGFLTKSIWRPERFSFKYFIGCVVFIKHIPSRSMFFNLEVLEGAGATISRSAGTRCQLIETNHATNTSKVQIPSGKYMFVSSYCAVVLGRNSNALKYKTIIGKCGSNVIRGFKSKVRGVAMNPVDHPHGGRTKTNSPEVSLWGKVAKKGC